MNLEDILKNNMVITMNQLSNDKQLVKEIQIILFNHNILKDKVDGILGQNTKNALTTFCNNVKLNNMKTLLFGKSFINALLALDFEHSDSLTKALRFTLQWEGGYVNNPLDLGGATNHGITQSVYTTYLKENGRIDNNVINITTMDVHNIYSKKYWDPTHCNLYCEPLSVVMFDTAVNFGVVGAIKFIQSALGLKESGIWSEFLRSRVILHNNINLAKTIIKSRINYRYLRVKQNTSQKVFLQGWLNRDNNLLQYINGVEEVL